MLKIFIYGIASIWCFSLAWYVALYSVEIPVISRGFAFILNGVLGVFFMLEAAKKIEEKLNG